MNFPDYIRVGWGIMRKNLKNSSGRKTETMYVEYQVLEK